MDPEAKALSTIASLDWKPAKPIGISPSVKIHTGIPTPVIASVPIIIAQKV